MRHTAIIHPSPEWQRLPVQPVTHMECDSLDVDLEWRGNDACVLNRTGEPVTVEYETRGGK
jgi:hypothetical protein